MCTRPRAYSDREFRKILKNNGYERTRSRGDHLMYSNGQNIIVITPHINKVLALRLIKQNQLAVNF